MPLLDPVQTSGPNARIVALLLAVTFLACASSGAMQAFLALHLRSAEGSGAWSFTAIGVAGALFAGGILIGAAASGAWVRPQHADRLLVVSCAAMSASAVAYGVFDSLGTVLATRLLEGLSVGLFLVASESMLLDRAGELPGTPVAARYTIANAAGHILGPALAGAAVAFLGPAWPFHTALLLAVLATGLVLYLTKNYGSAAITAVHVAPPRELSASAGAGGSDGMEDRHDRALGALSLADACACTFAFGGMQSALLVVLPPLLETDRAWSTGQATGALALFALGATLAAVPSVRLAARFRHGRVLPVQTLIGGALLAVLLIIPAIPAIDALLVLLFGLAVGSLSPVCLDALRLRFGGRTLLRATAIYNGFYAAGLLLGAPAAGWIAHQTSESGAVVATSVSLGATTLVLALIYLARKRAGLLSTQRA
jgi:MFS family permease